MNRVYGCCSICTASKPLYHCVCLPSSEDLCVNCIAKHVNADGGNTHMLYPKRAIQGSGCERCSMCAERPVVEMCCCRYPVPLLCDICKRMHVAAPSPLLHTQLPLYLRSQIASEQDFLRLKHRLINTTIGEHMLRGNLHTFTQCIKLIDSKSNDFIARCAHFIQQQRNSLAKIKTSLEKQLSVATLTAKNSILTEKPADLNPISALYADYEKNEQSEALVLFKPLVKHTEIPINRIIGINWQSKIDAQGAISPEFGQKVGDFSEKNGVKPPLECGDCEEFVKSTANTTAKSALFYKTHWECRKAMQSTLHEAILSPYLQGKRQEWLEYHISLFQRSCCTNFLPFSYKSTLISQLEAIYELKHEVSEAQVRNFYFFTDGSNKRESDSVPENPWKKREFEENLEDKSSGTSSDSSFFLTSA